ncbi:hypothetical protein G4W71_09180 [Clostridium botulinum]|uniref:Uncharacterized protein n=1 Tax=Clostridium botulinum TaxID=1491 RepID=A0A077K2B9_CLOBO|nr:hypothetical protein [Clostridium botulinum]MBE1304191.1 hypothetical protein [Clostridium botulinum]BAP25643.1 hypothetical protein [Clostridium botulinum]
MTNKKMIEDGICPYCNKKMSYEDGENGYTTEYWWECEECGRSYDEDSGEDITQYEFWDLDC